jgi:hypothetical protein
MVRFIVAVLFFFMANGAAQAQSGREYFDDSPERLIGLLDLDDIVRGGCGEPVERTIARVFSEPSETSSAVGSIRWVDAGEKGCGLVIEGAGGIQQQLPAEESGYEIPAAIVYERRDQWFRIRLAKGSAWIRRADATDFLAYPDTLRDRLAYILQGWDGVLRETPGASRKAIPLSEGWKQLLDRGIDIDYVGSRRVDNDLWIYIRLTTEGECGQKLEGVTPVSGWIPAYRPNRSPSVWFSSRGC